MYKFIILFGLLLITGCAGPETRLPWLIIDESVNEDFELIAEESWLKFIDTFEPFHDCIEPVTLKAKSGINGRGYYDQEKKVITVRVPATRAILEGALIHEWAHHLEYSCDSHHPLRVPFLEVSGFTPDTPWRPGNLHTNIPASEWAKIPSEQYAETVVAVVLGHRSAPTNARVTKAGIGLVEKWANGDLQGK